MFLFTAASYVSVGDTEDRVIAISCLRLLHMSMWETWRTESLLFASLLFVFDVGADSEILCSTRESILLSSNSHMNKEVSFWFSLQGQNWLDLQSQKQKSRLLVGLIFHASLS